METEMPKLGSSLPVPSVKELMKQPMTEVPAQYVHPNQDPTFVSYTTSLPEIPIIDLSKLLSEDAAELEKLHLACKEWGFFQLINHGVNPSVIENVKIGVEEFFNLPIEEKKKLWQKPGDIEGFGQLHVVSEEQKLDWGDMFSINTHPLYTRHPHLFPSIPQPFRDNLEAYSLELKNISLTIIGFMTKALKIEPPNEMLDLFEDIAQVMRMNYYPPCPQPELVIGLTPHADGGALSIVLQVNEIEGLQIRKDGMWIPVKPISNAFVINMGYISEILTNGIYPAIEHRATINSKKERISLATFHKPGLHRIIGPVPSLVTPERPAMFKSIGVADFLKSFFSRKLQGKLFIDVMRTQNETANNKSA